jgi:hypothetical protein
MLPEDVGAEVERLKIKKIELANRLNLTDDYDEKEELRLGIERIQKQIDTLEKLR